MILKKYTYLLAALLLFVFTADLNGQFRRKKVKLSQSYDTVLGTFHPIF